MGDIPPHVLRYLTLQCCRSGSEALGCATRGRNDGLASPVTSWTETQHGPPRSCLHHNIVVCRFHFVTTHSHHSHHSHGDNRFTPYMATTNSDRERMAALGARLMGSKIASSPRATPSATAPRSMPTAGKSTDRENMPLFARSVPPEVRITPPGNRAEPTSTTKPASAAIPSTKTSTPVLHERVLNVPEKATASPSKNSSNSLEVGAVPSLVTSNAQHCLQTPH